MRDKKKLSRKKLKGESSHTDVSPSLFLSLSSNLLALLRFLDAFNPPRWLQRTVCCLVLGGQSFWRIASGKVHWKNTVDQLLLVGPRSLGVALLTASFVGMVFTIQVSGFFREIPFLLFSLLSNGTLKQGKTRSQKKSISP